MEFWRTSGVRHPAVQPLTTVFSTPAQSRPTHRLHGEDEGDYNGREVSSEPEKLQAVSCYS
jgi:hypothetical protein